MLEGIGADDVNIKSALALADSLELLPQEELSLHLEEIREKLVSLRDEQANGIDTPKIRQTIARLTRLAERAVTD